MKIIEIVGRCVCSGQVFGREDLTWWRVVGGVPVPPVTERILFSRSENFGLSGAQVQRG